MRQNAAEFDEAENADGIDNNGLNFSEFCDLVRERELGEHTDQELRERFHALDITGNGRVNKHEYLRFSLKDALARSVTRVREIFEAWDVDGNGEVSEQEFRRAVSSLGFADVETRHIDHVFRELDDDGSGMISYFELDRKLRKFAGIAVHQKHDLRRNAGGRRGAALATTVKLDRSSGKPIAILLSEALSSRGVRVIDLFRDWDEDGSGLIDKDEFFKAMAPLGIDVSREEANDLFDEFDKDLSGEIEFRELNKMLRQRVSVKRGAAKAAGPAGSKSLMPPGPSRLALLGAQPPDTTSASGVVHLPSPRQALLYQHGLVGEYQHGRNEGPESSAFRRDITPGIRSEYTGAIPPNPWSRAPELSQLASLWLQPTRGQHWRTKSQTPLSALLSPRAPLPPRMKPSPRTMLDAL